MGFDTFLLFGSFTVLMVLGVPITYATAISAALTFLLFMNFEQSMLITAQQAISGIDSFTLVALPFFILAGNIMNRGGLARRLVDFARVLVGPLPGSLLHVNIVANMLFGAISGSAMAAAAAVGGVMAPIQKKEGYDPAFSAAVNITSCPTGLLIPPSNAFIVYSLITGGTSVSALFLAGYLPGILMGLSAMAVAYVVARRDGYPVTPRASRQEKLRAAVAAILPLGLVFVIMGGIIGGAFTATEASGVAVLYTLILALFVYREMRIRDLPAVLVESAVTSAMVLLMIGCSVAMARVMAFAGIPQAVSAYMLALSDNPVIILLIVNAILLVIGTFMDLTPALLIFTPIFLPVVTAIGIDPVHFGVIMVFNLCIGIWSPPSGSALFVGCSLAGVSLTQVFRPLIPFFVVMTLANLIVTFVPWLSLALPNYFLGH